MPGGAAAGLRPEAQDDNSPGEQMREAAAAKHYQLNRSALKRIRKLSDWFIRRRGFRAENMRK